MPLMDLLFFFPLYFPLQLRLELLPCQIYKLVSIFTCLSYLGLMTFLHNSIASFPMIVHEFILLSHCFVFSLFDRTPSGIGFLITSCPPRLFYFFSFPGLLFFFFP